MSSNTRHSLPAQFPEDKFLDYGTELRLQKLLAASGDSVEVSDRIRVLKP